MAFGGGEAEARNHGGEVPAEFDLFGFGEDAEKFWFVAIEEAGLFCGGSARIIVRAVTWTTEGRMDDFALASWSVIVELLKRLEANGVLDRSDIMEVLDDAARPLEGPATSSTMPKAAAIIRRFAASL